MSCRHIPPDANDSLASGTLVLRCLMENLQVKREGQRTWQDLVLWHVQDCQACGSALDSKLAWPKLNNQSIAILCSSLAHTAKMELAYSGNFLSPQWALRTCLTSTGTHMLEPWILVQQFPSCGDSDQIFKLCAPWIRQAQCCCEIKVRFKTLIT